MANERLSFMVDNYSTLPLLDDEQITSNIFSFIDFGNDVSFEGSPLSSPFLQVEDGLSPTHLTSDVSSPEQSSPDQFAQGIPSSFFSDPTFQSFLTNGEMEEVQSGMLMEQIKVEGMKEEEKILNSTEEKKKRKRKKETKK